jgi:PleD family two-component response regulator
MQKSDSEFNRPPVVLLVNDQEWSLRSLESIIGPRGYAVIRAYNGFQGLERMRTSTPDIIICDLELGDMNVLEFARNIRNMGLPLHIPIIITTSSNPGRQLRLDALEAGAWDLLAYPLDGQELVLKLKAYSSAKFDADRATDNALMDHNTGMYNMKGLAKRAKEMGSHAYRHSEPMACVVFSVVANGQPDTDNDALARAMTAVGEAIKTLGRESDAIGKIGRSGFAVVAPETNQDGAILLAERFAEFLKKEACETSDMENFVIQAGYDAVSDFREAPIDPTELITRATSASHRASENSDDGWLKPFLGRKGRF